MEHDPTPWQRIFSKQSLLSLLVANVLVVVPYISTFLFFSWQLPNDIFYSYSSLFFPIEIALAGNVLVAFPSLFFCFRQWPKSYIHVYGAALFWLLFACIFWFPVYTVGTGLEKNFLDASMLGVIVYGSLVTPTALASLVYCYFYLGNSSSGLLGCLLWGHLVTWCIMCFFFNKVGLGAAVNF